MAHPSASGPERPPGGWWDESLREFAPFFGLGLQLALAVLLFFFLGWWFDAAYETSPWGQLLGVLVGTTGGMVKFFMTVTGPEFREREDRKPPHAH